MNFKEMINQEAREYGGGGQSDKFEFDREGVYRMRILCMPKVLATHFFGKGNPSTICVGIEKGCPFHKEDAVNKASLKLVTYIIDRKDSKVKLAELPLSVSYSMDDLKNDEDFAFDEFPMPYDVKITYDPNNPDPKAKYRMVGSPKREELTDEETQELEQALTKMTPEDYVAKRKEKQLTKIEVVPAKYPTAEDEGIDTELENF